MIEIRKDSINAMLKICYETIEKAEQGNTCQKPAQYANTREECSMLTLGSFVHRFKSTRIMSSPQRKSSDIDQGIESFFNTLRVGKVLCLPRENSYVDHSRCNLVTGMLTGLSDVLAALLSPVMDHHLRYVECQAKKGLALKSK